MSPLLHDLNIRDRLFEADRREGLLLLLAAAFIFANVIAYSLVVERAITWSHLWAPLLWLVSFTLAYLFLSSGRPGHDPFLLPIFALLTGWGLLLMDRLAVNFLGRQTIWLVISLILLLLIVLLPRSLYFLQRYRYTWLIGGLLLLAATLIFGVNPSGAAAALWLPLPLPLAEPVYFQPSELLKAVMVVFLASYFADREALLNRHTWANGFGGALPYLLPLLLMWGFSVVLLVWQRDLGAATLFFLLFATLLYVVTGEKLYVIGGLLLLLLAGALAYFIFSDVVALRIDMWVYPWAEVRDRAYQIVQSLYALAAGGLGGQGIGQGYPDFVPVVHSDFAFAAIAEEWGLVGSLVVVGCFAVLAQRGLRIAVLSQRPFHTYLAAGITAIFSAQAFLIMGGVTRLLPLTGITLPFVSYGGSSLLVSSAMLGLLLFLSAHPVEAATTAATGQTHQAITRRLKQIGVVIFAGFFAVALALLYWGVVQGNTLLARDDNPRLVIAEQRVRRGRILDHESVPLALTLTNGNLAQRQYPLPAAAAVVGYYSLRYGTAGIEAGYDAHLRGENDGLWPAFWRGLLHQPPVGRDIRLTLDAELQQAAATALANRQGALVLLEIAQPTGTAALRAMVSAPGYDPNQLDAQFETLAADPNAPLFNRAAQGGYQPGLMLQPLLVASAMDDQLLQLDNPAPHPDRSIPINGTTIQCQGELPGSQDSLPITWEEAVALGCPGPLETLAEEWGANALSARFNAYGLTTPPNLPLETQIMSPPAPPADPLLAAVGQENLTVSPLQIARAYGALVNNGRLPTIQLVEAVRGAGGRWQAASEESGTAEAIVTAETAADVTAALQAENSDYSEQAVSVLAGPEGTTDSWYAGMTTSGSSRYVLVLILENQPNAAVATQIGRAILDKVRG